MKICRLLLTAVLCSVLFTAGCSSRPEAKAPGTSIYYLNSERTGLVKEAYETGSGDALEEAEKMLEVLRTEPDDIEHTAPIPEEVSINACELTGSILEIDFSREYLGVEPLEEKLIRAAVVQSLVQISGINAVSFTVDGSPLKNGDNTVVGLMNADDFVENTGSSPSSYQTGMLTLYFTNEEGDKLVTQDISVRYSSNVSREKLIVEKLMQGPNGERVFPTVNPSANLLSVTIKDRICYVNFDTTFLNGAYDVLPEVTIYSIVNSLVEGTDAEKVQISINGESNTKYMGKVDLSQPLEMNEELIADKD